MLTSRAVAPVEEDPDQTFLQSLGFIPDRLINRVLADPANDTLPVHLPERQRWLVVAALQHMTSQRSNLRPERIESERLDALISFIEDDESMMDIAKMSGWLKNLPVNRSNKHANRERLLKHFAPDISKSVESETPSDIAERTDSLTYVKANTSRDEWTMLNNVAHQGINGAAETMGIKVGTLKSRISRCRSRLRDQMIA